jgi:hypothetical protein
MLFLMPGNIDRREQFASVRHMGDLSGIVIFAIKPIARHLVTLTSDVNPLFSCEISFAALDIDGPETPWAN